MHTITMKINVKFFFLLKLITKNIVTRQQKRKLLIEILSSNSAHNVYAPLKFILKRQKNSNEV